MDPRDLLRIAALLAAGALGSRRGRPRQAELRRAVSTAYYAMFHTLAACCARQLARATPASSSQTAWRQTYRALEPGYAKRQCERHDALREFPLEIRKFAQQFVLMQFQRHSADYDPEERFLRTDVLNHVQVTERVITQFNAAPRPAQRAFALYVLLRAR